MHPVVRRFSEHRPRMYGVSMLAAATVLGFLGHSLASEAAAFWALLLTAVYGLGGIFYLALGTRAHRWDLKSEDVLPPASLTWKQVSGLLALSLVLLFVTAALFWLLR